MTHAENREEVFTCKVGRMPRGLGTAFMAEMLAPEWDLEHVAHLLRSS